jgi:flagellar hook protein FlgE
LALEYYFRYPNILRRGSTLTTGNTLDFKITGEGYFIIQGSDGNTYYTRNGAFDLDDQGNLVTQTGNYVMGVMVDEADVGTTSLTDYDTTDADDVQTNVKIDSNLIPATALRQRHHYGVVKALSYTDAGGNTHTLPAALTVGSEVEVGRVTLATFVNAVGLEREGDSQYSSSTNSGAPLSITQMKARPGR